MKELFKNIIHDFIVKDLSAVNDRDYEIPFDISKIITIIGARRTGKTYLLFSIIKNLRKTINSENLIYINFEDDRLFPLKLEHLNSFIEAYYELYPDKKKEKVYFFFDEVQQVENWELFIRRIYDNEKCRIYITGSSSKLLSKEIASSLRGRTLSYSIFPYSFKEYLLYHNIKTDFYTSAGKLNSADKIYYELSKSYPEDYAILYKWTLLLKQRGSNRINNIAAKIPQNSEYYPLAQQVLKGNQIPKTAQCNPAEKTQIAGKTVCNQEKAETIIPQAPETGKTANTIQDKKLPATKWMRKLMLLIILILILILIYHLIANIGKRKKKPTLDFKMESENKTEIPAEENKTLVLMVQRLLDSGWKNSEIARELKISEEEVERLMQLRHQDES